MLKIHTLILGLYQVNCYMIHREESNQCLIIDPGYTPEKIQEYLHAHHLEPQAILLTHGHFDHVGGMRALAKEENIPVYMHPDEYAMPQAITGGDLGQTLPYPEKLQIAGLEITVLHTPGHTQGSVCLMVEDTIFSGDTLFAGSCGRTDLPGGDWVTIQDSLNDLKNLPGDYRVFPGHGDETTLSQERKFNPYMR
jgi:glyoxylase-like metal-dependent hydrolase (beta-lactamase superfamily II)